MSNYYHKYSKYKSKYLKLKGGFNYDIYVNEPWFSLMQNNIKTVEGRPNKGIFSKLKVDDVVTFMKFDKKTKEKKHFKVKVTQIKRYNTFKEMLEFEHIENVLPDPNIKTIEDGVNVYRQWYSSEIEKQYGIIAIHIKKIE
jgi:ASC-1-like (ASCH) protein